MMKMIKLTTLYLEDYKKGEGELLVNVDSIISIDRPKKGKCSYIHLGELHYHCVKETPEEILKKINLTD